MVAKQFMSDSDSQRRFILEHTNVRGIITHLDNSWRMMLEGRDYPPIIRDLLGQAATAICLLSATLKFNSSLTLQIQGGNPINLLVMQVNESQHFRGMAEWQGELNPASLQELCRGGQLSITIEKESGERYQSIIDMQQESLARALHSYFQQSEQLPTDLWLATNDEHAVGMLLQALPEKKGDHDPDAWNRACMLASTLTDEELLDVPTEELLHRLYHEEDIRLYDASPVAFRCDCSQQRVADSLRSIGKKEVQEIIDEQGMISINCGFCQQEYQFDRVDAAQLFSDIASPYIPPTQH